MIYIIPKMLVLFKNHLNYFKGSIFEFCFKDYNSLLFFFFKLIFITYNNGKFKSWKRKHIKYIRNLFRLKKVLN